MSVIVTDNRLKMCYVFFNYSERLQESTSMIASMEVDNISS
jgi:hypothetical protein